MNIRGVEFTTPRDIDVFIDELTRARREWSKRLRSEAMSAQIADCLTKDMTLLQIAEKLNCSIPTVQAYAPKDVKRPYLVKNARYEELLPQLKRLKDDGMSRKNVCRKLHIGTDTYYKLLAQLK